MNFEELGRYITELHAIGLDTTPLRVQYYKKFPSLCSRSLWRS